MAEKRGLTVRKAEAKLSGVYYVSGRENGAGRLDPQLSTPQAVRGIAHHTQSTRRGGTTEEKGKLMGLDIAKGQLLCGVSREGGDGTMLTLARGTPGARLKRWKVGCRNKEAAKAQEAIIKPATA